MNPMISTILFLAQQIAEPTTPPQPDLLQTLLPFVFMGVLYYFLLIRRQQKRRKQHEQLVRKPVRPLYVRLAIARELNLLKLFRRCYEYLVAGANLLQSPFLLALRLYFFWQLFLNGKGKLENIGKVTDFFGSLGIPLPTLNAYFIGSLECFGSLLLIIGLASRPLSLLIVIWMTVFYLTADFEAVSNIFSDPDKFVKADPFPFILTAFIVLVSGPGRFSVDALIKRRVGREAEAYQHQRWSVTDPA